MVSPAPRCMGGQRTRTGPWLLVVLSQAYTRGFGRIELGALWRGRVRLAGQRGHP